MIGYHFTSHTLRGGLALPKQGEWLVHDGPLELCKSGLHASLDAHDATKYRPEKSLWLHKVELGGEIINGHDKVVAQKRKILVSIKCHDLLHEFGKFASQLFFEMCPDAPPNLRAYYEHYDMNLIRDAERELASMVESGQWTMRRESVFHKTLRKQFNCNVNQAFHDIQPH